MGPTIKNLAVNWVDGMKVARQNFLDQENHFYDVIRDARSLPLNRQNYGIIPSVNANSPLAIELMNGKLVLRRCRGITAGGNRVEIVDEINEKPLVFDLSILTERYHLTGGITMNFVVVVKIDPFKRVPCKDINVEEQPPRHPWSFPFYQLDVLKQEDFNYDTELTSILPVAKLAWKANGFIFNERFIAPCLLINALPRLHDKYVEYKATLSKIYEQAINIIKKIKRGGQSNIFYANIFIFTIDIAQYISSHMDEFNLVYANKSPVVLLSFFAQLSRTVELALARLREEDRVLNYISNNSNLTPEAFLQRLQELQHMDFNLMETIELLDKIDRLMSPLSIVFDRLNNAEVGKIFA